jgi:hypothetical protein
LLSSHPVLMRRNAACRPLAKAPASASGPALRPDSRRPPRDHRRCRAWPLCRPPLARGGQVGRATSREVSGSVASLRRSPAAPYRPGATGPRTIPLRRWPGRSRGVHPSASRGLSRTSPLRCLAPRVSVRVAVRVCRRRRPRGSFVAGFLKRRTFRARSSGCSRGLAGLLWGSPATPVGFAALRS